MRSCFPCFVVYVDFCSIFYAFLVVRLYQKNTKIKYKHTTVLCVYVVRLYDDTPYFKYKRTTRQVVSLARISRANVFATQKQCFCLEWLSAPNCIFALRFKRKGRLARLRGEKYSNLAQHQIGNIARATTNRKIVLQSKQSEGLRAEFKRGRIASNRSNRNPRLQNRLWCKPCKRAKRNRLLV